jgi:hypothetical protein
MMYQIKIVAGRNNEKLIADWYVPDKLFESGKLGLAYSQMPTADATKCEVYWIEIEKVVEEH